MIFKSKLLQVFILFLIGCTSVNSPQQESIERKQLFDFDWKFNLGDTPEAKNIDFDDNSWRKLDLPHDWSIEGEIKQDNPSSVPGGYFSTGIAWYRKTFNAPSTWQNKKITIYFEGVYMNSEVFVNGKSVGIHPYGYTSFYYDITPHLKYDQENTIAVKVDNSQQVNCRWYSGSGIYRHVWLTATDPIHVDTWGVAITTPKVSKELATVELKTLIKNETATSQTVTLSSQIKNAQANNTEQIEVGIELVANEEKEIVQTIEVAKPLLWSPENPNLYEAEIKILKDDKEIDVLHKDFGIRSIEFSVENGFVLNGEKVILNGGCVHHDNGCLGAKAYNRAEERKVELLKAAGFNAVRTSHNPPSEAFLDACDRLGLFVIDEAFDGWRTAKEPHAPVDYSVYFDEWWEKDITSMVMRDRNHPSIIMWSIGNEIIERTKPEAVETARMLAGAVHQIDTTRPVTSAMTTWDEGWEIFDPLMAEHDVCGYNYQLFRAEADHERVPSRIIVNTESYPNNAFNIWSLIEKNDYIIGDFVWTAMDYLGESSIGRYFYPGEPTGEHYEGDFFPWHGAYCGDIDLTGWRKPISHYRDMLYNNSEKLYLAVKEPNPENGEIKITGWAVWPTWESWTWPGFEGKEVEVEVYTKSPTVRLYLNNKLIGEETSSREKQYKAIFKVPYQPGELKAVVVEDGKESASKILKTADKATNIALSPDHKEMQGSGQDLVYVTVEITDANGTIQPNAENLLTFSVEGPGEIIGVENANLKDLDKYVNNKRKAWKGRAMVVVKGSKGTGEIKLKASAEGFADAITTIQLSDGI